MRARIVQVAEEEGLETVVEIAGVLYRGMDCIGYSREVREGDEIDIEFSVGVEDDNEDWEDIFNGNPDRLKLLKHVKGWSYIAYGEIVSINPVVVDCAVSKFEDVIETHDERCIGEFVSFSIIRLDVFACTS